MDYLPDPPFEVYCADDTNRPNEIPISKWIRKGLWYTVIAVTKHNNQQGLISFTLEEINLSDCQPYIGFDYRRFRLPLPEYIEQLQTTEEV